MSKKVRLSVLPKTWILDLDGTVVKHNGYILDGVDMFLPGAKEFLQGLSSEDMVIFLTSRKREVSEQTEAFLQEQGIRYDAIIYGAPYGERILINDRKPSGLTTAIALNAERNRFVEYTFVYDERL